MFLKLKTLKIKAFRRFAKEQVIDFTQREKIFQIDGVREETGGSSGSGKSSIIMAIDYLFGVSDIADAKLQSWLTKEPIEVEATFDAEDLGGTKQITITRGKKTGLVIDVDGEITSGSSKLSEEKLDEIIGIPRPLFRRMYHKKQKEGGFFINLTGSQSYKTLVDILGLKNYTEKMDKIDQKIKDEKVLLVKKEAYLEGLSNKINDYNELIANMKKPVLKELPDADPILLELQKNTNDLHQSRENKKKELEDVEKPVKKDTIEISSEIIAKINQIILDIGVLEATKKELVDKKKLDIDKVLKAKKDKDIDLNNIKAFKVELKGLAEKESKLAVELEHIQQSQCPTCMQAWIANTANEAIVKIQIQLVTIKERKAVIEPEIEKEDSILEILSNIDLLYKKIDSSDPTAYVSKQIDDKKAEMAVLNGQRQSLLQEITNANNASDNSYKSKINEINSRCFAEESALDEKCRELSAQIRYINTENANYDKAVLDFESNHQLLASNLIKAQKEHKESKNEIDNINKSINIGSEAKRAIKSYTMSIFQGSLDEIGEQATRILNTTPNMATASIYFESAKENKDGKIKEEINGVLSVDGEEDLSLACLSGGEGTSIELAVDLSFLDMVENRVKIGCDFFFLDEPFQGLDSSNALPIIELLKENSGTKRIAVIDHNAEIKEMIEDKLVVERVGTESNIMI